LKESNDDATGIPVSQENDALLEYGRNSFLESLNVIKDFIKIMIPLTTGLITIYFALLQFLGIQNTAELINKNSFIIPPVLLLVSLICFIIASFPIPKKLALSNINSIKAYRSAAIKWKYIGTIIGSAFFIMGMLMMILNAQSLTMR